MAAASGTAAPVSFEKLSLAQGLSQSIVEGALQDRRGFLWFATEDGLNRWDGYRFSVFRNVAGNARSLSYNELKCLVEDRSGMIWIGTFEGGLNRFDPATGDVTRFRHDPADPASLPANTVRALSEDRDGRIWVGTQGGGLARLDPGTGRFERFRHDARDPGSLAHDDVRALLAGSLPELSGWGRTEVGWTASTRNGASSFTFRPRRAGRVRPSSRPFSRIARERSGWGRTVAASW